MFQKLIEQKLQQRQQQGLLRRRIIADSIGKELVVNGSTYLNFSSNDYLGLAAEPITLPATFAGSKASPLVIGRQSCHLELEQKILSWLGGLDTHQCLLFSSGYAANSAVISGLFSDKYSNAILIQDKLNHASLLESGKNVQANGCVKQVRFNHNDMNHLAAQLLKTNAAEKSSLVVTEGVFSMDGDCPNLEALNSASKSTNSWWMLDDAHGIGVFGNQGAGSLSEQNMPLAECDVLVVTFGKGLGAQGAAVITRNDIADYLINFSKEYIYSTHISPLQCAAISHNIDKVMDQQWRRDKLQENIASFRYLAEQNKWQTCNSHSAIQGIIVGDEVACVSLSEQLKQNGIWAAPMRYPTVGKGKARLRITLTTDHEQADLELLFNQLAKTREEHDG